MIWLPWNKKQTYQLNSRPLMWPSDLMLVMTLTWIFKVKFRICYISSKNGPIATKWKINILIELEASKTIEFELGHDLERCCVRIYCIVARVTLHVGVPSTLLVLNNVDWSGGIIQNDKQDLTRDIHSLRELLFSYLAEQYYQVMCTFCMYIFVLMKF